MQLTPDDDIVFSVWGLAVNATIVNTWIVMALLVGISMVVTRNLRADVPPNRWRTALEVIVKAIQGQIEEITRNSARHVMYFAGTLFLFIALSNLLLVIPGFSPPTSSLSTTTALALSVLVAVPLFGVASKGVGQYLKSYIKPSVVMLPFNIIGEFSRGISLAIRLYGNVMSGAVIAAILLSIAPFFFPGCDEHAGTVNRPDPGLYFRHPGDRLYFHRNGKPRTTRTYKGQVMTDLAIIAAISIFTAGLTVSFGALGPALGEGRAAAAAIAAIAQQPDAAGTLSRTLFVSLAMIESTAIYCFVVAMILIFANPFWNAVAGG